MYLAQDNAEVRPLCSCFHETVSLWLEWVHLIRGRLEPPALIYANVRLRIKVVHFLIISLVLKTLDSLPSSNIYLNLVIFLVPCEKKIGLEISSTVTSINHVTWPTREIHMCLVLWNVAIVTDSQGTCVCPMCFSFYKKQIKEYLPKTSCWIILTSSFQKPMYGKFAYIFGSNYRDDYVI